MPKTKISEFSATPANNTDIDSINIAEGCAPSGINDAIRELMAQLKDFQTGAVGDSFNGPVGSTTPAAGAFTTLSASSTATLSGLTASTALALDASKNVVSVTNTGTGSNVLATSPTLVTPTLGVATATSLQGIIGNVTPAAGAFTSLTASTTLGVTGLSTLTAGALIEGLTVGRGPGAVSTNTAVGASAMTGSGGENTGIGSSALGSNTTGVQNVAVGRLALQQSTTTQNSVAVGYAALQTSSTGNYNTAVGSLALNANTTASNNTAVGYHAGYSITTGISNVTVGSNAGYSITTGLQNTCLGEYSGQSMTTGGNNTFVGQGSGYVITTGAKNVILGSYYGNQDGLDIRTASNYVVIADGDGNRQITMKEGQTLALDSAVPNAGTGITFPADATVNPSANANTLDDYEEGTWTPTQGTFDTWTSPVFSATYTKIGRLVTVFLSQQSGTVGWSASDYMGGLPFTVGANLQAIGYAGDTSPVSDNGYILADGNSTLLFFNAANASEAALCFTVSYQV